VTEIDSTCRITCLSLWTEKKTIHPLQKDVKPSLEHVRNNASKLSAEQSSPNKAALKSIPKRKHLVKKSVIVKTTSGPFISAPLI